MNEQLQRVNFYLDVDGVINAVSSGAPRQNTDWHGEWRREKVGVFQIQWATELIDSLNAITARREVDGKWLTTWEEQAPEFLAPAVGLQCEGWPVLTGALNDSVQDWWKLGQIQADIAATAPAAAIWIDDEIATEARALEWLTSGTGTPILHISPNFRHGLTRKHVEVIEQFLDDIQQVAE